MIFCGPFGLGVLFLHWRFSGVFLHCGLSCIGSSSYNKYCTVCLTLNMEALVVEDS